jgi:predicted ATPase/DNA-binding CsgD family transcriptional regulator
VPGVGLSNWGGLSVASQGLGVNRPFGIPLPASRRARDRASYPVTIQSEIEYVPDTNERPRAESTASLMGHDRLPRQLSSFVGRAAELDRIPGLLQARRLVTVTGPGGIGKTRLALRAAAALHELYRDGACLADMSRARDRAHVLGMVGPPATPGSRQQLIIMDNCEHFVGPCTDLAVSLLHAHSDVHVLAASREVLRVAGEAVVPVPPLSVPAAHETSAEQLGRSEAGWLFLDRLTTSAPELALTAEMVPEVADLCCRLEGVPLALELAAARVRSLGMHEVGALVSDLTRLLDLGGGDTSAPARHRTLRSSLDWSFSALAEGERRVLYRLAELHTGWTLAEAQTACAAEHVAAGIADVLDTLVAKSLIAVEHGRATTRYSLLDSERRYILEHTEWCANQARCVPPRPGSAALTPREREVLSLLARGYSNKEIGASLAIANATARVHVEHILTKLALHSRTQAALWALGGGEQP